MMIISDYKKSVVVSAPPRKIFECLTTGIPNWWTEQFEGASSKTGDKFTVHFGSTYKTMILEEVVPDEKLVWKCIDAYIDLPVLTKKDEWKGTHITWEVNAAGNGTTITITHTGLNPAVECYEICEQGWESFLNSLMKFILAGKGEPFRPVI